MTDTLIPFIKSLYNNDDVIPLHQPTFCGNEKDYLINCIDSGFVSSVGSYVSEFEKNIAKACDSSHAVAVVNGTSALHVALFSLGVGLNDYVITQSLTFVASCNAIQLLHAKPILIDVDKQTMSLCPDALANFLQTHAYLDDDGICRFKKDKQLIKAVVPMHTLGHPAKLSKLMAVCKHWNLSMIEDAAESLGSLYQGKHTGSFSDMGVISFNGNKIITSGGGGVVLCNNQQSYDKLKHLTTTAKLPHPYEFHHDQLAFNYRMPNINAALALAQLENLTLFLKQKRALAQKYQEFFKTSPYEFISEQEGMRANYWLNAIVCESESSKTSLLIETNQAGIHTRPLWILMHELPMYKDSPRSSMKNSSWLVKHVVCLPSTPQGE